MSSDSSHTELPPVALLVPALLSSAAAGGRTTQAPVSSLALLAPGGSAKLSDRGRTRGDPSRLSVWPVWLLLCGMCRLLLMAVNTNIHY